MRVFVTGASGWIGSAVVPELIGAGHQVTGLARSDASAAALTAAGAQVQRGTLDDLDILRSAAAASDGVIHLAFKHDIAFSGGFQGAAEADRRAIETFGEALAGSGRPFVIASGTLGLAPGRVATERDDGHAPGSALRRPRAAARRSAGQSGDDALLRFPRRALGSRCGSPRRVHGEGDNGFMAAMVGMARARASPATSVTGPTAGPPCTGSTPRTSSAWRWRHAPAGSVLHAVADEGVPIREIAEVIGRHLDVPVASVSAGAGCRAVRLPRWLHGHRRPGVEQPDPRAAGMAAGPARSHRRSRQGPLLRRPRRMICRSRP